MKANAPLPLPETIQTMLCNQHFGWGWHRSAIEIKVYRGASLLAVTIQFGEQCPTRMPADFGSDRERDRALVARLKSRNPQAMTDLYDRYGKLVFSVIFRAVKDGGTAEDLTQETFLRVWNRIQTFDEERGRLEAWLVTVARNRAFDHLRAIRNAAPSFADSSDLDYIGQISPEDTSSRIANERTVKEALKNLSKDQREVIELTHFEGMTQTEIALKLQKPLGTVKSLVRSALKNLRTSVMGEAQ